MFGLSGGRLTADMILRSPQYMNPCGEYEIDLRGNKIAAIENLGATENQFCSMDMSDNEIVKLGGFPLLPRLRSLYLNKNRIARIAANLEASVPNLETLVLTGNRIASWDEVRNLSGLKKLRRLVLLDNPLARQDPNAYRRRVLLALPQVKDLDFQKVKAKVCAPTVLHNLPHKHSPLRDLCGSRRTVATQKSLGIAKRPLRNARCAAADYRMRTKASCT